MDDTEKALKAATKAEKMLREIFPDIEAYYLHSDEEWTDVIHKIATDCYEGPPTNISEGWYVFRDTVGDLCSKLYRELLIEEAIAMKLTTEEVDQYKVLQALKGN